MTLKTLLAVAAISTAALVGNASARESTEWANPLSEKCAREIMNDQASPECEAEGKRWSDELMRKLSDPSFRQRLINRAKNNWAPEEGE